MIVVSDTTPLNYLVLISAVEVLPKLFSEILVPSAVLRELTHPNAPVEVRQWAISPPGWLTKADPFARLPSTAPLDPGEADAISLARERGITDVLIDEYHGRMIAMAEGLIVLPTLAVLEEAAEKNLLDLPSAIASLRKTTYRVRAEMLVAALERDAVRKGRPMS